MGGADLSDQMKVSYQVDRRSKFLDISVVNSKIIYDKVNSTIGI